MTDGINVAGDFPVRSAVTTVGVIRAATLTCSKGADLPDPEVGTSADISNFSLSASGREIELRRLTLLQAGSINNADLTELELYQGSGLVAYANFVSVDRIVFQFPAGLVLSAGVTTPFTIRARIGGPVGRTIRLYVEYPADVEAFDPVFGSRAQISATSTVSNASILSSQYAITFRPSVHARSSPQVPRSNLLFLGITATRPRIQIDHPFMRTRAHSTIALMFVALPACASWSTGSSSTSSKRPRDVMYR